MSSRIAEYSLEQADRCYCCTFEDGENYRGHHCINRGWGRTVRESIRVEPSLSIPTNPREMFIGVPIAECLLREFEDDANLADPNISTDDNEIDRGLLVDIEDNPIDNRWHEMLVLYWIRLLKKYQLRFVAARETSTKKPNEPIGIASELVVEETLFHQLLSPLIISINFVRRNTSADRRGIDIALTIASEVEMLLKSNQVFIQVKSSPKYFLGFIDEYERKNNLDSGEGRNHLLKHNFILLNGGAGRVRDIGVIAPFIAQLHQLICLNNSPEAGNQFLQLLGDELQNMLRQPSIIEILERDYSCILDLSHLHHAVF